VIDLHTHSTYSDGSDTPSAIAAKAQALGLTAIALTDHDSTSSYQEMAAATGELGLDYVVGVEVSLRDNEFPIASTTETRPRNVHVLAYFIPLDPAHPLQVKLASLRHDRDVRNQELVSRLQGLGFDRLSFEYLVAMTGNPISIGRPHFARAMFELHPELTGERNAESWNQIFVDWLGSTGRAYIPKTSMPIEEFVAAAQGSSTVFSIAHPLVNYVSDFSSAALEETMPGVLNSLRERGIRGVEAYYGSTHHATRQLMVKLARDAGMIPTGGSDYHGRYKQDVLLGFGKTGDLRVPDEVLSELREASGA
jgi:hypothetical protein